MNVRIRAIDLFVSECGTRLPFRFGTVTLRQAPLCVARVVIDSDAGPAVGLAADLLVPKWFERDPRKSPRQDAEQLARSTLAARDCFLRLSAASVFDLWRQAYVERVAAADPGAADLLVRGFGVALLERALMDAACRAAGTSLFAALRADVFRFRPAALLPQLAGWELALPHAPLGSIEVRHTVGLADHLWSSEITQRIDDDLPEALEEDLACYGISCLKVKLAGSPEADLRRLLAIAELCAARLPGPPRVTVDANEQYRDLGSLATVFDRLRRNGPGAALCEGLLYIEQPLPREMTFDADVTEPLRRLSAVAPVLIDEADASVDAFARALALGYRGVSVKSCKGIFRALLNRGLCEVGPPGSFQSAEDLTSLPVLSLQQDLCLFAALGLTHAERNGHHYFRGLAHLPDREAQEALVRHPDLYRQEGPDIVLAIENGRVQLGSLQCRGFGYDVGIVTSERGALADWLADPVG